MYESLPTPFGLVRHGVAPDHPEVKACEARFADVAAHPTFRFLGNLPVGAAALPLREVRAAYDGVVLAHGAAQDRVLGVPGEGLRGVFAARDLVAWYNGLPGTRHFAERLALGRAACEEAVVVGQGNVALDVARMLLTPVDALRKTDTPEHVLAALAASKVRRVRVVGRRGPMQAAFTIKELRELATLPGPAALAVVAPPALLPPENAPLPRVPRRLAALLRSNRADEPRAPPACALEFMLSPTAFLGDDDDAGRLQSVQFSRNEYVPDDDLGDGEGELPARFRPGARVRPASPTSTITMPAGLALRSIGYRGAPLPGLQDGLGVDFDPARGVVPNLSGRALRRPSSSASGETASEVAPGIYVAGWLKTGPTGVIARTMDDAFETAEALAADAARGAIGASSPDPGGWSSLRAGVLARGARPVSWADWLRIDAVERARGAALGKPREKVVDVAEMLAVLDG
jgi:adrenodoxin-NADP+ reductase